jgi:hypothetical protein
MEQKCIMTDCEKRGEPQKEFDFYLCDDCVSTLAELFVALEEEGERRVMRHANN